MKDIDVVEDVLEKEGVIKFAKNSLLRSMDRLEIPIIESGAPIIDEKNDVAGAVFVFEDISERRVAENALQESEERYKNIFELSPNAIMTINIDGVVTSWNNAAIQLTGSFTRV